jgi:hypothetical protein
MTLSAENQELTWALPLSSLPGPAQIHKLQLFIQDLLDPGDRLVDACSGLTALVMTGGWYWPRRAPG